MNSSCVTRVFKSLCVNKATGPDNISAYLLKTFADCHVVLIWGLLLALPDYDPACVQCMVMASSSELQGKTKKHCCVCAGE